MTGVTGDWQLATGNWPSMAGNITNKLPASDQLAAGCRLASGQLRQSFSNIRQRVKFMIQMIRFK